MYAIKRNQYFDLFMRNVNTLYGLLYKLITRVYFTYTEQSELRRSLSQQKYLMTVSSVLHQHELHSSQY